jgi:hypothetical protein
MWVSTAVVHRSFFFVAGLANFKAKRVIGPQTLKNQVVKRISPLIRLNFTAGSRFCKTKLLLRMKSSVIR